MSQRETNLLSLRDTLEHLTSSRELLDDTRDPETTRLLTQAMIRDLERCKRACQALHSRCLEAVATR